MIRTITVTKDLLHSYRFLGVKNIFTCTCVRVCYSGLKVVFVHEGCWVGTYPGVVILSQSEMKRSGLWVVFGLYRQQVVIHTIGVIDCSRNISRSIL